MFDRGLFEEALKPLQKAVELDAKYGWALTTLGVNLAQLGRTDEAIATLKRSLEITPQDAGALMNLGSAFTRSPISTPRSSPSTKVCGSSPMTRLRWQVSLALHAKSDFDGAIDKIAQAARLDPTNADHRYWLGSFLEDRNRHHEAVVAFREAIKLRPDYSLAHSRLSVALYRDGQVEEATRTARETARLYPKEAFAHYDLGTVLMHRANGRGDQVIS